MNAKRLTIVAAIFVVAVGLLIATPINVRADGPTTTPQTTPVVGTDNITVVYDDGTLEILQDDERGVRIAIGLESGEIVTYCPCGRKVADGPIVIIHPVDNYGLAIYEDASFGERVVLSKTGIAVYCQCEATGCVASATPSVTPPTALATTPAPTGTPTPTETPPTPTPSPTPTKTKANCGVGNGVDGDTPGCPNGRNDGPGTGPGHPGSQGGNGNSSHNSGASAENPTSGNGNGNNNGHSDPYNDSAILSQDQSLSLTNGYSSHPDSASAESHSQSASSEKHEGRSGTVAISLPLVRVADKPKDHNPCG